MTVKIELKIKGCDIKFHPDLDPGVVSMRVVDFKTEERAKIALGISNQEDEMVEEAMEFILSEQVEEYDTD